jgi:hypothetical protein
MGHGIRSFGEMAALSSSYMYFFSVSEHSCHRIRGPATLLDFRGEPVQREGMPSQPSPLQQSNEQQRSVPRALPKAPKAPLTEAVAKRLLYHSTIRPVQRFDSADFFLDQHYAKARVQEAAAADDKCDEIVQDTDSPSEAVRQPAEAWQNQLQTPPPLPQRAFAQQP